MLINIKNSFANGEVKEFKEVKKLKELRQMLIGRNSVKEYYCLNSLTPLTP